MSTVSVVNAVRAHKFDLQHEGGTQSASVYLLDGFVIVVVTGTLLCPDSQTKTEQLFAWYAQMAASVPSGLPGYIAWPNGALQLMPPKS